jgi:hypothetical protein
MIVRVNLIGTEALNPPTSGTELYTSFSNIASEKGGCLNKTFWADFSTLRQWADVGMDADRDYCQSTISSSFDFRYQALPVKIPPPPF